MKVKELIEKLQQTKGSNEVRIITNSLNHYIKHFYLSFDDIGDVLIYEVEDE